MELGFRGEDMLRIARQRVTELMVDRSRSELETYNEGHSTDRVVLELDRLQTAKLSPLSISVRAGEVLGITGPVGAGMEQIELSLGGIAPYGGNIRIDGRPVSIVSPSVSRAAGVALIPEDRRKQAPPTLRKC